MPLISTNSIKVCKKMCFTNLSAEYKCHIQQKVLDVYTVRKIKPPKIQVYSHSPKSHCKHLIDESEPHYLMTTLLQTTCTHVELESFCPLSNNFISRSAVDVHLVLEKIVPSRCVAVPIERDGCPGAPYEKKTQT